ncbi:MAG: ATP-binding protein [Candidatus Brocadiaceae bacterium]|nr:ATP-binding protein [Candidatus Brocadiaceae bacterium]
MNKHILTQIIMDQKEVVLPDFHIPREKSRAISKQKKTGDIIILTGIRRSGKSTLLQLIRNEYETADYYMNFDDERLINFEIKDFQLLYELFIELFGTQKVLFFDEIQNIEGWERFARRLHDSGNKVYITGSNASMMSRELGTRLTGRHIQINLFPFSFSEFLELNKVKYDITALSTHKKGEIKRVFNRYFELGGFPDYVITENKEYLKSLYESIIYRDIIVHYKLANEKALKELVYFSASNMGKEISFNSLKQMTGLKSASTIKEYFGYLENSFILFLVPRFDYSLKKQIYANKKVYFIDPGLAQTVGFRSSQDRGRLLENIVYLELKRDDMEIYYYKDKKECDFIIKKGLKIVDAIQVTQSLSDSKTKKREVSGLIETMVSFDLKNGLILTEDEEDELTMEGRKIIVLPIWKWMLSRDRS